MEQQQQPKKKHRKISYDLFADIIDIIDMSSAKETRLVKEIAVTSFVTTSIGSTVPSATVYTRTVTLSTHRIVVLAATNTSQTATIFAGVITKSATAKGYVEFDLILGIAQTNKKRENVLISLHH